MDTSYADGHSIPAAYVPHEMKNPLSSYGVLTGRFSTTPGVGDTLGVLIQIRYLLFFAASCGVRTIPHDA